MSKRIFAQKKEPLPSTENGRTPICYYHKLPITHFCVKKQCTLPLCDECLPIHKKEHINSKQIAMEGIVQFEKARGDALAAFQERKIEIIAIQGRFRKRVQDYKDQLFQIISNCLEKFCEECLVTDGNLEILQEIEERTSEIRSGSLKELIRYYEDIFGAQHFRKLYKMYFGDYLSNFKYEPIKNKLEELTKSGIISTALRETDGNKGKQTLSPSMMQNQEFQITEVPPSTTNFQNLTPMIHHPQKKLIKQKDYDSGSETSSHRLQIAHQRKQQQNIYTDSNAKVAENFSSFPSNNPSQGSRSQGKRKKGLSLTKSHGQLPLDTKQSFKSSQEGFQTSETFQRKNKWRNFINMNETNLRNNSRHIGGEVCPTSREQKVNLDQTPVLNPREMRQLLLKKKDGSKMKGEKELRVHKSSAFILGTNSDRV